jgi:hypothetical protein
MARNLLEIQDVALKVAVSGEVGSCSPASDHQVETAQSIRKRSADLGIRRFAVKLSR